MAENDLIELAERCEAAIESDRQIDGLVWRAIDPDHDYVAFGEESEVLYRRDPDDRVAFEAPPAFTASLDAAVKLVPEGHDWDVLGGGSDATAMVFHRGSKEIEAATPALALCAAALRARAA